MIEEWWPSETGTYTKLYLPVNTGLTVYNTPIVARFGTTPQPKQISFSRKTIPTNWCKKLEESTGLTFS